MEYGGRIQQGRRQMADDGRDAIRQMEDGIWWEGHSKTDGRWQMEYGGRDTIRQEAE
jgi:hypothetical protein